MTAQGLKAAGLSPQCAPSASQNAESETAVWGARSLKRSRPGDREKGRDQVIPTQTNRFPKIFLETKAE
jgi:hypothetical protein